MTPRRCRPAVGGAVWAAAIIEGHAWATSDTNISRIVFGGVGAGGCALSRREGAGVAAGSLRIGRTAWPAAGSGVTFSRDADRVTSCWRRRDRPRRATRAVRCRNVAHSAWNGNRTDATWVRPTTVHTTVWRVGTATIGYPGKKKSCVYLANGIFIIIIIISYYRYIVLFI